MPKRTTRIIVDESIEYYKGLEEERIQAQNEAYEFFSHNIRELNLKYDPTGNVMHPQGGASLNNDVDAFRHAYASGNLAMKHGDFTTNLLGHAYELKGQASNNAHYYSEKVGMDYDEKNKAQKPEQYAQEKNMDLWNNRVGRETALLSKNKEEFARNLAESLKQGKLITNPHVDSRIYENPFEGDSYRIVKGISEADVARRHNVPVDRVIENYGVGDDLLGRPHGQKTFTIMPEKISAKAEKGWAEVMVELAAGMWSWVNDQTASRQPTTSSQSIPADDEIHIPKPGSKLYAGKLKAKIAELTKKKDIKLEGASETENEDGDVITEVDQDSKLTIDGQEINTHAFMELLAREQADQMWFTLENIIKFDTKGNNILKFTQGILNNLFGPGNGEATGKALAEGLIKGIKIEKICEELLRTATAKTAVDGIVGDTFAHSIGKDILLDFAINFLGHINGKFTGEQIRMMAYSSANKIVTREIAAHLFPGDSVLQSSSAAALAHVAMHIISAKGKLDETAWLNLGVSGVSVFAGTYIGTSAVSYAAAATGSSILGAGLASGFATAGIGAVISLAICSAFKFYPKHVSTYISSHSVTINKDGVMEYVTMRPQGTVIIDLGKADKIIQGLGVSDAIVTGAGNDKIILHGDGGGFAKGGNNSQRQPIKVKDEKTGTEVDTFIYLEKIIGSTGNDNLLDGQAGDDYINGRDGNDRIIGGDGNDLLVGGDGDDTMEGNNGDDIIYGDAGNDLIDGGKGNDEIFAGEGDDGTNEHPIKGGDGDDIISGGKGVDIIQGGKGDDVISGDDGIDILAGGEGTDLLYGGSGDDHLDGEDGNDNLEGGEGNDKLYGGKGNDLLTGDDGNDILSGDEGDDLINGGLGEDYIVGGAGNDTLYGGLGNDTYVYKVQEKNTDNCVDGKNLYNGDGDDVIEDVAGENNTLIIENVDIKPSDLQFNIAGADLKITFVDRQGTITVRNFVNNQSINTIQLYGYKLDMAKTDSHTPPWVNVENDRAEMLKTWHEESQSLSKEAWYASYFNEEEFNSLSRNTQANLIQQVSQKHYRSKIAGFKSGKYHTYHPFYPPRLDGDNRDNELIGNYWSESIYGHGGKDRIYGNNGDDYLFGGKGEDRIEGGNGNDFIYGNEDNDKLLGGEGNDTLYGNQGDDELLGEKGKDQLFGGDGNDHLDGGDGADILEGENGDDTLLGGNGNDKLHGGKGKDKLNGGDGDDEIHGDEDDDVIEGNNGNDKLHGGSGNDSLSGGSGDDELYGDNGDDYLYGDSGDDKIHGGNGDDHIYGGDNIGMSNQCNKSADDKKKLGLDSYCAQFATDKTERNYLYGDDGNDYIRGNAGADYIDGGDGDDEIYGGPGDDTLKGGPGNDAIYGGEGNDRLYAGAPSYTLLIYQTKSQLLSGGAGQDTYYYNEGDGHVEIDDCAVKQEVCKYDADILTFGPGVSIEDITIIKTNNDAYITFWNGWSGSITLKNQFAATENRLGWLEFSDGTKVAINNMLTGTNDDDTMPFSDAQTVFANRGNDDIQINAQQMVSAGYGDDIVKISGNGNQCYGGYGSDTYSIGSNARNVNIHEISPDFNTIRFTESIRIQDIIPRITNDNVEFILPDSTLVGRINKSYKGEVLALKVGNSLFSFNFNSIEAFVSLKDTDISYQSGSKSEWIMAGRNTASIRSGGGDDILVANNNAAIKSSLLEGENGNDIILGNGLDDFLKGGKGDDILYGDKGCDKLVGGEGNDSLYGGEGKDYFIYTAEDRIDHGQDRIYDFNCGLDLIELSGFGYRDKNYLNNLIANIVSDSDGNAVLEDKGNFPLDLMGAKDGSGYVGKFHITLIGVKKEEVTSNIFTFSFSTFSAAKKSEDFYKKLPDYIVSKWFQALQAQFLNNVFIDTDDINLPSALSLGMPVGVSAETPLLNELKDIGLQMARKDYVLSLPMPLQRPCLEFYKAAQDLKTNNLNFKSLPANTIEKALLENLYAAKQLMDEQCPVYETSLICTQFNAQFDLIDSDTSTI